MSSPDAENGNKGEWLQNVSCFSTGTVQFSIASIKGITDTLKPWR